MDKVFNDSITITLGGREYQVSALPISRDLEWRRRVGAFVARASSGIGKDNLGELLGAMITALSGDGLDELLETMWMLDWDPCVPDLTPRDQTERVPPVGMEISREELMKAMVEVFKAYYVPFVEQVRDLALLLI